MKKELLELARKNGVDIARYYSTKRECMIWVADISCEYVEMKHCKKLSTLIKFLSDNNIKINN